jgi:hypothetical protein
MFRQLSKDEAAEFRLWARRNYAPGNEISELWHPVVQDECRRMCEENGIRYQDEDKKSLEVDFGLKN